MMAKMFTRKSFTFPDSHSDNQSTEKGISQDIDNLLLPEEDEEVLDTRFIHWGYLNCCHTVSKGKKIKREKWNTYWVDLCGSTLRFYKDSSLHIESHLSPPPSSPQEWIAEEYETKVAFFELENATVRVLHDWKSYDHKSKKSSVPKIFRRHLFQLKLRNIRSTYVFQAPSHSTMLRWVSKIQESLDTIENNAHSIRAEERLKLVRDMARSKSLSLQEFVVIERPDGEDTEASLDVISVVTEAAELNDLHPTLRDLRRRLAEKQEQLMQFETQIIDFLGNKGDFLRAEFVCRTKQDYLLITGRMETFIPVGTKVSIFGQLPNRRWRCLVEMNELIKVMNELVEELKNGSDSEKKASEISNCNDIETLETLLSNIPEYPLLGCIPTSVLDIDRKTACSDIGLDNTKFGNGDEAETDQEKISLKKVSVSDIILSINENTNEPCLEQDGDYLDKVDAPRSLNICDFNSIADDVAPAHTEESESGSDLEDEVPVLRNFGTGVLIRKKLRQKGLSIIVGSSSSEEEGGQEENNGTGGKTTGVTHHLNLT